MLGGGGAAQGKIGYVGEREEKRKRKEERIKGWEGRKGREEDISSTYTPTFIKYQIFKTRTF